MDFSIKMELSALLTLVVLFVFHHEKSRQRTEGYHLFSASLVFSMLTILVDVLSTVAIYHAHHVPLWLNVALVCAYFILLALALSLTAMYAFCILLAYSPHTRCIKIVYTIILALCAVMILCTVSTPWTGWLFRFEGGEYFHGPLNRMGYGIMTAEVLLFLICYLRNRSFISQAMRHVIHTLPPLTIFLALFQLLVPQVLINGTLFALVDLILFAGFQSNRIGRDQLTELQNRGSFYLELSRLLKGEDPFHVILLSLRHYSSVNRRLGVRRGDEILYQVSRYLEQLAPGYRAFRVGNTQFALLGKSHGSNRDWSVSSHLQSRFSGTWQSQGMEIVLDAALADMICLCDGQEENQLIEQLEYALSKAEQSDQSMLIRFDERLQRELDRKNHVLEMVRRALAQESFQVYYQPIYHCQDRDFASAESLLRLFDDDGTPVPPGEFIPLAEENGLIDDISWLVLKKVCQFWQRHPDLPLGTVSINMPMQQLTDPTLVQRLSACRREYGVPPEKLRIEITERMIAQEPHRVRAVMTQLNSRQIQFYLDDFGMGYSNFAGVMSLPFETVKLDASLLRGIDTDPQSFRTVQLLVQMLKNTGFCVVAEGIETEAQVRCVQMLNIDRIQGYYYARPMPEEDLTDFLSGRFREASIP